MQNSDHKTCRIRISWIIGGFPIDLAVTRGPDVSHHSYLAPKNWPLRQSAFLHSAQKHFDELW